MEIYNRVRMFKWLTFVIIMLTAQPVFGTEVQGGLKEMLKPNPLLNEGTQCYKNLIGLGDFIQEYADLQDAKKFKAEECANLSAEECSKKRSDFINSLQGVLSLIIQNMNSGCIKESSQ